ncbi:MAG: sigma-70 family RNA polymerase sigma factor [Phycisphaerae bacterium]|nr:sigma-70 family RNA polymerase sigma factor [Phycisphaerae bacterium]
MISRWMEASPLTGAQRALVARHLGLVRLHLRRRISPATRTREADDLFQEGCLGLIRAARRYDARAHGAFAPYALARIRGSVHRALADRSTAIRVPVREQIRRRAVVRGPNDPVKVPLPRVVALRGGSDGPLRSRRREGPEAMVADAAESGFGSTIGQQLREKHALALDAALEHAARRCRRPDARVVLELIVRERLAIPCEHERTPLRAIGRRFGVSIGRVMAWQRAIKRIARGILAADDEFVRLRQATRGLSPGVDGTVSAELAADLVGRRREMFRRAFTASDRAGRGLLALAVLGSDRSDGLEQASRLFARRSQAVQRRILARLSGAAPPSDAQRAR